MKRPPGLWILLSAGVLWLSLQDVYGIRATALIFGKSSTTTTTTEVPQSSDDEVVTTTTESSGEVSNVTKPTLTGIPQLDYIWDPNLPKELNGYNLSEYPFYERVPEDIDFKCDGLHDGFYASVPHKCQVYHHCLFGTRYDFLCANYTAFDQKTFICHFVSEVDCVNSKKFWHRNDALYQAATTTTLKPVVIHTTAPPGSPMTLSPSGPGGRRPMGGRRRPLRRRRPQYEYYEDDYYDDYYEERPRAAGRRKRPRPRPRPVYDDEYDEEYEDDRYERRGTGRRDEDRRRPYDRRTSERRRTKDRRKPEYDDEIEERFEDDDFKNRRNKNEEPKKSRTKHNNDDIEETDHKSEKRRPTDSDRKSHSTRKGSRRPTIDEYDDELPQSDERPQERPRKKEENRRKSQSPTEDTRTIIKPVSGTIYDRPRLAPRIKLPVPKNEAEKYAYKPIATQPAEPVYDEEYYDDYEEEPLPKRLKPNRKHAAETSTKSRVEDEKVSRKQVASASRPRFSSKKPAKEEDSYERPRHSSERPKYGNGRTTTASPRKRPSIEEYDDEDYYEDDKKIQKSTEKIEEDIPKYRRPNKTEKETPSTSTTTTTTTTTTTQEPYREKDPIVRVVKRPFLPSRGGNPYSSRGLQPVGSKAIQKHEDLEEPEEQMQPKEVRKQYVNIHKSIPKETTPKSETEELKHDEEQDNEDPIKALFKPSPVLIKIPIRQKFPLTSTDDSRTFTKSNKEYNGPRTTQKPKLPDPLDLNEYDVTLNDALNPTLPNLPVRGFPTGFSPAHDYTYSSFQRQRYVLDPVLSPASTDYVYHPKQQPIRQRYETVAVVRDQQQQSSNVGPQYSTINGQNNYRPRVAQQTQAYYSTNY